MMELKYEANGSVSERGQLLLVESVDRLAPNADISTRRLVQSAEYVQQRALAGAARSNDRDHFAAGERKVNALQDIDCSPVTADVGLVEVVCFENGRHSCLIASIGYSRDAWIAGYSVATADVRMLARTIHATSTGCVATGK